MAEPLWEKLESRGAVQRKKEYAVEHGLYGARTKVSDDIAEFIEDTL